MDLLPCLGVRLNVGPFPIVEFEGKDYCLPTPSQYRAGHPARTADELQADPLHDKAAGQVINPPGPIMGAEST